MESSPRRLSREAYDDAQGTLERPSDVKGWAEGERREGQVCQEVYLSKEVVVQEKGASEAQEEDGMDPWATQGMSMGYGEAVSAAVC
jgi:hypothetical protein